ncbi:hypothetical protein VKS41_001434 [Umbelopsis sp. WA50703]
MDFVPEHTISFSDLNVKTIKEELTKQLESKERLFGELGGGGISRNVLQRQIKQIKERLEDIEQMDEREEIDSDHRMKLQSLERELSAFKSEQYSPLPTISFSSHNSSTLLPTPVTNSTPTKRKSKVPGSGKRNTDIEFATEIGQGLLIEVRKLQAALQNKEDIIKQLHMSKSDDERTTEMLMKHLKQKEESEEKYKEQNWSLEVANEELRNQLAESNQNSSKSKAENTKLAKRLRLATEQNDTLKAQVEKAAASAESAKVKHEQDMQTLRRTMANLQRENGGYKDEISALKSELDVKSTRHNLRATVQEAMNLKEEPKVDAEVNLEHQITPKASTSTPTIQNGQSLELTTTKQSLAHAHRLVNNLRMSLHKEKQEKHELKKLLAENQEVIEQLQHDVHDINSETRSKTKISKRMEHKCSRRPKAYGVRSNAVDVAATDDVSNFDDGTMESFDSEIDSAAEDDKVSDNFDNDLSLSINDISSHTTMKSLSSELAESLILEDPMKSTIVSPAATSDNLADHLQQNQSSQSNDDLSRAIVAPSESNTLSIQTGVAESRQRTLSTSSLTSMSASPRERNLFNATLAPSSAEPSMPHVSLSSCTLSSQSAIPITPESKYTQTETLKPRERTLSTSRLVPVSAAPMERGLEVIQSAPLPRKSLSSSMLKPFNIEPTQMNNTAIETNVNNNASIGNSSSRQRELSTSKLAPCSVAPAEYSNTANKASDQQQEFVSNNIYSHDHKTSTQASKPVLSESLRWSTTPNLNLTFATEQFSALDNGGNNGKDTDKQTVGSDIDKNVGKSVENRSIGLQWPAEQEKSRESSSAEAHLTSESVPTLSNETSSSDHKVGFSSDNQVTGAVAPSRTDLETSQPSRTIVESIDTASSPISEHFSIPDVHQTTYSVGPNGEQMMTRNEAEALAAAYLADALSKNKVQHSSQRLAWEQGRLLKGSSMGFLNAPPRPETPPSPNLIAKSAKPPKTPKMFLAPSPKPSKSTPAPVKTKSLRSSTSNASLRPALPGQSDIQPSKAESREGYGHALVRKSSLSLAPSTSSSLSGSSAASLMEYSLQRKSSFMSQTGSSLSNMPTNLSVITAITKTMIGEWLWKYTRRTVGGGISEHRHRRFFWVHPYTRTLYWSVAEPGVDGGEALAKSAYIEAVMSMPSRGSLNDSSASLLIKTATRELKVTAPDMELHTLWYKSLSYLLDRSSADQSATFNSMEPLQRTQSTRLPRKPSFQRVQSLFSRNKADDSSISLEPHHHDHPFGECDGESTEDVRKCCDGKHHLANLSQKSTQGASDAR